MIPGPAYLVALALVAGASAGAAFVTFALPPPVLAPVLPSTVPSPPSSEVANSLETEDGPQPSEEYQRIAQALLAIDERLNALDERQIESQTKTEKLLTDVRELALQLEIRTGQLKPLRTEPQDRLIPLRPGIIRKTKNPPTPPPPAFPQPATDSLLPGVTEDGLPAW